MSNNIATRLLTPCILLLLLMLAACHNLSPWGRKGEIADSLIEQHPDSVLLLLQDIDYNALDEEGQAHYGLLLTAARYKLYQPVDTTFINRSIDYYSSHLRGDKRGWGSNSSPLGGDKRGASLYYKAVVIYDLGKKQEATLLLKQAEQQAERSDDELLRNKIYEKMFAINELSCNYQTALLYGKRFLQSSLTLKDRECVCRAYDKLAYIYCRLDSSYQMRAMQDKCLELADSIPNEQKAYILSNIADSKMNAGEYREAMKLLLASRDCKELPNTYLMLGKISYLEKDTAQARKYWEKVIQMDNKKFQAKAYRQLSEYHSRAGRYQIAMALLGKADSLQHCMAASTDTETIANAENGYDLSQQISRQKMLVVSLSSFIALLVLMLTAYQLYVWRLRKRESMATAELREAACLIADYKIEVQRLEMTEADMKAKLFRMSGKMKSLRTTLGRERIHIKKLESEISAKQQAICQLESSSESYTEQLAALQQEMDAEKTLLEQSRISLQEKTILADRQMEEKAQYEEAMARNEKEKRELQERLEDLYEKYSSQVALGKFIHDRIAKTKSYPHLTREKERALVDFYLINHYEKFSSIIGQYDNLTVGLLCYLVLEDMGLSNEEMQAVLNVKASSVRMRLKRLNDRKKK